MVTTLGGTRGRRFATGLFAWIALTQGAVAASLTAQPGQDLRPLVQRAADGDSIILPPGSYPSPVIVSGAKRLTLKAGGSGVFLLPNDRNPSLAAVDGADLMVEGITIEKAAADRPAVFVKNATLTLSGCAITHDGGDVLYAENAAFDVSNCVLASTKGTAVIALKGSRGRLAESGVTAGGDVGLHFQETGAITLNAVSVEAKRALYLARNSGPAVIEGSRLTGTGSDNAIAYVDTNGAVSLRGTIISGKGRVGLTGFIRGAGRLEMANGVVAGGETGLVSVNFAEPSGAGPSATFDEVLVAGTVAEKGGYGLIGSGNGRLVLKDGMILVKGPVALAVQDGATVTSEGQVHASDSVAVLFSKAAPDGSAIKANLLLSERPEQGGAPIDGLSEGLAAALGDRRSEAVALVAAAVAAAGTRPLDIPALGKPVLDLRRMRAQALESARRMGRIRVVLEDRKGERHPVAGVIQDKLGFELGVLGAGEASKPLEPGTYRIAAEEHDVAPVEVTLAEGGEVTAVLKAPGAHWLGLFGKGSNAEPTRFLATLVPAPSRAAIGATLRYGRFRNAFGAPLHGVEPARATKALEAARAWLNGGRESARPGDQDYNGWVRWGTITDMAYAILAHHGGAEDVRPMLGLDDPKITGLGADASNMVHAAFLEARLGRLETGELAKLAVGGPFAKAMPAAILLHAHGIRRFDDAIISHLLSAPMDDPKNERDIGRAGRQAFLALRDVGDPRLQEAALRVLRAYRARQDEVDALPKDAKGRWNRFSSVAQAALAWLVAKGDEGALDQGLRLRSTLDAQDAQRLMPYLTDVAPLAQALGTASYANELIRAVPALRSRPADAFTEAYDAIAEAYYQMSYRYLRDERKVASYQLPQMARNQFNFFRRATGAERPFDLLAEAYFKGNMDWPESAWEPFPERAEEWVAGLVGGKPDQVRLQPDQQLFYVADDTRRELFEKEPMASTAGAEVVRGFYDVIAGAFPDPGRTSWLDHGIDGAWRMPFLLRSRQDGEYRGAIHGILHFTPSVEDGRLTITARSDLGVHYEDRCSLAAMISTGDRCPREAWKHHRYVTDGGRALLEDLALVSPKGAVAPTVTVEDGVIRIVAPLPDDDLSGVQLSGNLAFFDQRTAFTIPLYWTDFARARRVAKARVAALEQRLAAAPTDPGSRAALTRALLELGDSKKAIAILAAPARATPRVLDHWFTAADLLLGTNRLDLAQGLLVEALAANPGNPDLAFTLGSVAYRNADFGAARDAYAAVIAAAPGDAEARLWLGRAAFLAGDHKAADTALQALPAEGQPPATALLRALAAVASGRDPAALRADALRGVLRDRVDRGDAAVPPERTGGGLVGGMEAVTAAIGLGCNEAAYGGWHDLLVSRAQGPAEAKPAKMLDVEPRIAFVEARAACKPGSFEALLGRAGEKALRETPP